MLIFRSHKILHKLIPLPFANLTPSRRIEMG